MSLSAFQSLISDLGQSLGAADMSAGEDGYVGLTVDDIDVHIQFEEEDDVVVLACRLQEVEPDHRDAIYSMLLAANLFWQGTDGATFSADFETGRVYLADRRARMALTSETLANWIERFVDVATLWRDRIESANDGGPLQTGAVGAGGAPGTDPEPTDPSGLIGRMPGGIRG